MSLPNTGVHYRQLRLAFSQGDGPQVDTFAELDSPDLGSVETPFLPLEYLAVKLTVEEYQALEVGQMKVAVTAEYVAHVKSALETQISDLDTSLSAAIASLGDASSGDLAEAVATLTSSINDVQADVNQNEEDADAAIAAVASDLETHAAENVVSFGAAAEAREALQSQMADNETARDLMVAGAISDQAEIDAEARAEIQADVDANEATAQTDRADIRSEFAAADQSLSDEIAVERGRTDAILEAAYADQDNFKAIVDLINSVDATNDEAFAGYVVSNNAALAQAIIDFGAADAAALEASQQREAAIQADVDANEATALAARIAIQADVDANEEAGAGDRAAIREELAAAIEGENEAMLEAVAGVQSDVDANEATALAARTAIQADVDANEATALAARTVIEEAAAADALVLSNHLEAYAEKMSELEEHDLADALVLSNHLEAYAEKMSELEEADSAIAQDLADHIAAYDIVVADVTAAHNADVLAFNNHVAAYDAKMTELDASDVTLQGNIDAVIATAAADKQELQTAIGAGDQALAAVIAEKEEASDAADAALSVRLDTLEADPTTGAALSAAEEALQGLIGDVQSALDTEIASTDADFATEAQARAEDVAGLQSQIDSILSNVDPVAIDSFTEAMAAWEAGDSVMADAVEALSTSAAAARETMQETLQGNIDAAIADASTANTDLLALLRGGAEMYLDLGSFEDAFQAFEEDTAGNFTAALDDRALIRTEMGEDKDELQGGIDELTSSLETHVGIYDAYVVAADAAHAQDAEDLALQIASSNANFATAQAERESIVATAAADKAELLAGMAADKEELQGDISALSDALGVEEGARIAKDGQLLADMQAMEARHVMHSVVIDGASAGSDFTIGAESFEGAVSKVRGCYLNGLRLSDVDFNVVYADGAMVSITFGFNMEELDIVMVDADLKIVFSAE